MSFTNINDPSGVKALLERLRASQAWQDTVNNAIPSVSTSSAGSSALHKSGVTRNENMGTDSATPAGSSLPSSQPFAPPSAGDTSAAPAPSSGNSVAALLSQLSSSQWTAPATTADIPSSSSPVRQAQIPRSGPLAALGRPTSTPRLPESPEQLSLPPRTNATPSAVTTTASDQDIRFISFQQALPLLTQLASKPEFIASVARVCFDYSLCSLGRNRKDSNDSYGKNEVQYVANMKRKLRWLVQSVYRISVLGLDRTAYSHAIASVPLAVVSCRANMIGAEMSKHEVDVRLRFNPYDGVRFD
ncbi:hypothetical protein ID866_9966 [Astraeus odoratus]|nr:hypothetical protein ID866_9966 [Astraeus odoratus]